MRYRTPFSCGTQRAIPSGQDGAILAVREANQARRANRIISMSMLRPVHYIYKAMFSSTLP
jgi:hypothetical protein